MTGTIQKYIDSAVEVLEKYGIMPQKQESKLVGLLEQVRHVDEAKVTAIAKVVRYMGTYNEFVREQVEDMHVGTRYMEITSLFGSIINDSKNLVDFLADGKLSRMERVKIGWMNLTRGSTHNRFEKIRDLHNDVTDDTETHLEKENAILEGYMDFRFSLKDAEATSAELLKIQEGRLDKAKSVLVAAVEAVTDYTGTVASEKSKLELVRDETRRAFNVEDRNYQLIKDVSETLTSSYVLSEGLMVKLAQTHSLKSSVYQRAITFFTNNDIVFTTLDALFTSQQGLYEITQTVEAMEKGTEDAIEASIDLGRQYEKAAVKAGYGATIRAETVVKLLDSVLSYTAETNADIDLQRKEATENSVNIRKHGQDFMQKIAEVVTRYELQPAQ